MADQYKCILLFGAPGTGKGTQGKLLGEHKGYFHLATGDIFRSLDKTSKLGKQFLHYSSRGELVPDDLTIQLWQDYVLSIIKRGEYSPDSDILLLDGMPRSIPQVKLIAGLINPIAIIHLVTPSIDEMVVRMKLRAEKEGRADDADENVIRNRFDVYNSETAPVLAQFDEKLVINIDAMGTIEQVNENIMEKIKTLS